MEGMKEMKIKIRSLGPVTDSEIILKPLIIFTGESGLGKSYCAFVVNYLFELLKSKRIEGFFKDKGYDLEHLWAQRNPEQPLLKIPSKELFEWINKDCIHYIGYLVGNPQLQGDVEFSIPYESEYFSFHFKEELKGLENQEESYFNIRLEGFVYNWMAEDSIHFNSIPLSSLIKAVLKKRIFGNYNAVKRVYVFPPARGSLFDLNERPSFSAGMYHKFFDFKRIINLPIERNSIDYAKIDGMLAELNEGTIKKEEGNFLFILKDGTPIPLSAAASSVKELAPLSILLNKFPAEGTSVLFEEPEAHLHPSRQEKLADIISVFIMHGGFMQITSHSDYFIKRLNFLIQLHKVCEGLKKEEGKEELLKEFDASEDVLLNPDAVAAYLLERKDDFHSHARALDIHKNNEIPFDSFYDVIKKEIRHNSKLRENGIF